jgi:methylglutaconyl-CoA hydratase
MSLLIERENQITLLSLNRPEKRNALNIDLMKQLCEAIEETQQLKDQRVMIIRGEGPCFCAGLDLQEALDESKEKESADWVARLLQTVYHSTLITIAAVHGAATAGGAGLMSACDYIIASHETKIGFPEVRRGLVPAQIATLLVRQLNRRQVQELLLLGELIEAERAYEIGLINKIVSVIDVASEAIIIAEQFLQTAPLAVAKTKQLLRALYTPSLQSDLSLAMPYHHESRQSSEGKEGIKAFFEKRVPRF